jgi:peptide/nickel transport system substrate-binding protein
MQLLDEAGWTPGSGGIREKDGVKLSFDIMHITDTTENQVLQAIAAMLEDVGIEMKLDGRTSAPFWSEVSDKVTAFALKWLWSSPMDVIDYFVTYLQAKGPDSEAYAKAYTAWQTAGTEDQMAAAAREMQLLYAERLPLIPVFTPNTVWVNHSKVVGWQPNQANLYPWYNDVWIAQ